MPRFTLRTLFIFITIAAVYCALVVYSPVLAAATIPLGLYSLAAWSKFGGTKFNLLEASVVGVISLILVGLLMPAVQSQTHGGRARRVTCLNNLQQIGLALASYHQANGCYPPAYIADSQGRPLISWRVLLLPYLGMQPLYDEWRQHSDEPWDGPNNRKISQQVLELLHCPSDNSPFTDTSYVAVAGAGTVWPDSEKVANSDITDGQSNTLLLVEVKSSGINWMEPRDLSLDAISLGINPNTGQGISSNHPGFVDVLFADGRTITLSEKISVEQLRALFTIDGGEKLEPLP